MNIINLNAGFDSVWCRRVVDCCLMDDDVETNAMSSINLTQTVNSTKHIRGVESVRGALKMTDMRVQNMKMTDQFARHRQSGARIAQMVLLDCVSTTTGTEHASMLHSTVSIPTSSHSWRLGVGHLQHVTTT